MDGKGTGLALSLMSLELATALLLFYLVWSRPDLPERGLGVVLGGFLLIAVLIAVIIFVVSPSDRRPIVFILMFFGLILLPGVAFMIAQALGSRVALYGPYAPSPWPLLPYVLLVAFLFVRIASWATTLEPEPGVRPASLLDLQGHMRVMGDSPSVPFLVRSGKRENEMIMEWKYADATWFDLMRAHRITYLSRLVVRFDESDHTVRVFQQQSKFDASGDLGSLSLSFSTRYGEISFYDFRKETVYGLQLENGSLSTATSYTYRFDVKELYGPLQALVIGNGWVYKNVPVFAKWLTG